MSTPLLGTAVLLRQLEALPDDLRRLVDTVDRQLPSVLPSEWRRIACVDLVGSGDSHHAARAATMAFHSLGGVECRPTPTLPFLEYTAPYGRSAGGNAERLIVAVSASGATPRVLQVLERARSEGYRTLALTTVVNSPVTQLADGAVVLELPNPEPSPGIRTFQASLVALLLIAVRLGEARGLSTPEESVKLRGELRDLADAVAATHAANVEESGDVAARVADAPAHLVLGSGPSHGTALFAAAKLTETAGVFAAAQDVEEWWHVERFAYPVDMPLFVIAPPGRGYWRAAEIAAAAYGLGRRVIAVTRAEDTQVARHAAAVLPVRGSPREEFSPLLYHLFAGTLAAALADRLARSPFQSDRPELRAAMNAYLAAPSDAGAASLAPPPPVMQMDDLMRAVMELAHSHRTDAGGALNGPDAELRESGFGSLETVRLMLAVEARFSLRFPAQMLDPEVFRTPRTLAEAVRVLQNAAE